MDKNEAKESFLRNWEEFITKLKGQLLRQKDNTLSLDSLSSSLTEVTSAWRSEFDILGRWLIDYTQFDEVRGKEISDVLFEDMKFEEIKVPANSKNKVLELLPWVGAALGFGTSYFFKASHVIQAVSTILPPAVLIPVANNVKAEFAMQNKRSLITEYLSQLDKYKNSILSIIDRE